MDLLAGLSDGRLVIDDLGDFRGLRNGERLNVFAELGGKAGKK